jgi:hypothetical protein
MKTRPLLVLLALAAVPATSASCQCSRGQQEQEQRAEQTLTEQSFKLQNGLDVDLVVGPCGNSSALAVLVKLGIDHDPPGRSGLAHLATRLLATSAAPGRAERFVEIGDDYMLYSVTATGGKLLEELSDVVGWMSKLAPTEADLEREKKRLLEELRKLQGADAASTALTLAEEALQPTRGNGKRRGIAAEVEAITLAELQGYWDALVKPGNARIAVTGTFDAAKVRAHIEAAFAPLPAGTRPVAREPADSSVKGTLVMGDAPSAVAVAVPVPATSDPLFAPFLVLAARLLEKPAEPRTWETSFDPIKRPEVLFITGPVGQAEQPEPAAGRMRAEVMTVLGRPNAPGDVAAAKERFRLFLEPRNLEPAICAKEPRVFAVARVRGAQLQVEGGPIKQALDAITKEQLDEAAKLFEPKRTAAVIAGGAIR